MHMLVGVRRSFSPPRHKGRFFRGPDLEYGPWGYDGADPQPVAVGQPVSVFKWQKWQEWQKPGKQGEEVAAGESCYNK